MGAETRSGNRSFIGSLEKATRVLEAFGPHAPQLGLTELARSCGLDRSSVQRLTTTLHRLGYLDKDPATRRYSLSIRMTELAHAYLWADQLMQKAMPRLIDLHRKLGETINFSRLDGSDIIYTARLPSVRTSYAASIIGRRVPALNTASGRVMLAQKDRSTRQSLVESWPLERFTANTLMCRETIGDLVEEASECGYSIALNELQMNEFGCAVAVRGHDGRGGAIHCSLSASDWTQEKIRSAIAPVLMDAANTIA